MELVAMRCKSCGATLPPSSINFELAMARCEHCGGVFALRREDFDHPASAPAAAQQRIAVPMPEGINLSEGPAELRITRRWFHWTVIPLLGFCVIWNGFMLVWHGIALAAGIWFMSCFGLIHTAVGIGLAYFVIASLLNRTTVVARPGVLSVSHRPVPWPGNVTLNTDEVEQLYFTEKIRHGKNTVHTRYTVEAVLRSGRKKSLLKGMNNADQALYVEQELERYLKIEDRPVRGELPR